VDDTVIEVFADVCCPFAHLGIRRFLAARDAAGRDDVVLHVRAWPLEIVNGRPLDPAFIAEEIDEIRPQLVSSEFSGFRTDAFPASSVPAMELTAAAYEADARLGERVAVAVRDALFEQGRRIDDVEVLQVLAVELGAPSPPAGDGRVRADHASGVERGVIGSPHFFTADGGFFCPALDISRDAQGHLRITADEAGFMAFLDGALG
jgi:2-hydroxychromene-2-carboxylate isomerase